MTKKKSIIQKAIDAVTTRDEKEEAEEARQAAEAARAQAARESQEKAAAEARARAAEARARAAEERAQAAQKAAAEAKAQAARIEAEKRRQQMLEEMELRKAQAAAAAEPTYYVVQPGDSLSKIARDKLGDASRWPEIFELNKDQIKDPNLIYPGQKLRLPK